MVGVADVVAVRQVAGGVGGDEDVGAVFADDSDDFASEGDGWFEVSVWEVEEFDGFEAEDASGFGLLVFADSAEFGG